MNFGQVRKTMDLPISSPLASTGAYGKYASGRKPAALSGSDQVSMNPRQTAALMPTELAPVGPGADLQDVTGNQQEQSRLVDDIRQTAEKANSYMQLADTHLEFAVSEQTGRIVISVVKSDTKEVIRQIPPETLSRFANQITHMRGLLFEASG